MKRVVLLFLFSAIAYAATTGTLTISGFVPDFLEITTNQIQTNLNLDVEETVKIGEITEKSNLVDGYKITLTSTNLGYMVRTGSSEVVPYSLFYDGLEVDLSSPGSLVKTSTNKGSYVSDVLVYHTANIMEMMVAGEYRDTITISIEGI